MSPFPVCVSCPPPLTGVDLSESSESLVSAFFPPCLAPQEWELGAGQVCVWVGCSVPVQYWKKPLGGSQGQSLESVNPKAEGMDGLGARKTPFFFFFPIGKMAPHSWSWWTLHLGQLTKIVLSHFPWTKDRPGRPLLFVAGERTQES